MRFFLTLYIKVFGYLYLKIIISKMVIYTILRIVRIYLNLIQYGQMEFFKACPSYVGQQSCPHIDERTYIRDHVLCHAL